MRMPTVLKNDINPKASGVPKASGLRYVSDRGPGLIRRRVGKGFIYFGVDRKRILNENTLRRIKSLAIPPAWEDVWICPVANGYLQAVGRDSKHRKQYRYHRDYRNFRDRTKFERMDRFADVLPAIRRRVAQYLRLEGLPKAKVLATIVRLLETTCVRIGNEQYAKDNRSFGLTTLHNKHVHLQRGSIEFEFRGKSGQKHSVKLKDHQVARLIRQMHDLPGYQLFEYIDGNGTPQAICSEDVNNYLWEITKEDFTAKDFRTWIGSGIATLALEEIGNYETDAELKSNIVSAVQLTSRRLGNRPATCRKYYIHPGIFQAYEEGTLFSELEKATESRARYGLRREEKVVKSIIAIYDPNIEEKPAKVAA
jgi:DNA topoisomerase I